VKALVEGMQGSINVKSSPGKGTTFFVRTILKKAETPTIELEEEEKKVYHIDGKVWLVDDDAFILKWCSSVMEMYKIEHSCFSSAEEALNQPWDERVKFVFTDMRMTGMNGAELCQRLRQVASPGVKFYVLTAQALPEERSKLLNMGFDGILMKPFHANELLELLQKYSLKKASAPTVLDLTSLNEMTFGDESVLREILDQFAKDSREDIAALKSCIKNSDLHNTRELMHRMAGRTGQIGIKDLSAKFRSFEIAIRDNQREILPDELNKVIRQAEIIVDQVEEKALSYSM
jgi:DNA-binding response OmpR family regulator